MYIGVGIVAIYTFLDGRGYLESDLFRYSWLGIWGIIVVVFLGAQTIRMLIRYRKKRQGQQKVFTAKTMPKRRVSASPRLRSMKLKTGVKLTV
mgnify:CR=1 FL=1